MRAVLPTPLAAAIASFTSVAAGPVIQARETLPYGAHPSASRISTAPTDPGKGLEPCWYFGFVSHDDVETLRRGYEAFNRGDWKATFQAAHPDLEFKTADRVANPGTYRGPDEALRFFEDLFEPFDQVVAEPQQFFERGDRIAVLVLVRLRPKGSSAVVENLIGHLWTMRDGKAARFEVFPEREKVLEAVGFSEQDARRAAAR